MAEDIIIKDKYTIKTDRMYTKTHEWVLEQDDGTYLYGITGYAATELGELAFVEFPIEGDEFETEESMGVIEALKTVADYYAPFDCEVVEVHQDLEDDANVIHEDCYGDGWMLKVKPTNGTDPLITAEEYAEIVRKEVEH